MKLTKFQKFTIIIILAIITALIITKFSELMEIIHILKKTNWVFIVIALMLQSLTYLALAGIYSHLLKIFDHRVSFKKLCKLVVTSTLLNQIFPSAGLVSIPFMTSSLKKDKIDKGKTALTVAVGTMLIGTIFLTCLAISVTYLLVAVDLSGQQKNVLSILLILTVCAGGFLYYLSKNHSLLGKIIALVSKALTKLYKFFKIKKSLDTAKISLFVEEFYLGVDAIKKNKTKLLVPLLLAAVFFLSDILTLYCIFLSFGLKVKLGFIVVSFVLTDVVGFIVAVPTGLGVFEVSMATIFSTLGIPLASAVLATLIFRGMSFWLHMPLGLYFYQRLAKEKKPE